MEKEKRSPEKMAGLVAGPWSWNLPDFHHQRPKIIKNHKIKNTPSILSLPQTNKKIQKVEILCFLMILATDQRGDLVWIRFLETLITEWKMTWIWKNNTIFRETTIYFYSWEHRKHVFLFFDSNAILLSKNIEKTLKISKNHQTSPNWRQNRVT